MKRGVVILILGILILGNFVFLSAKILTDNILSYKTINYGEKSFCIEGEKDGEFTCTLYKGDKIYPEGYDESNAPIILELDSFYNKTFQPESAVFLISLFTENGERNAYTDRLGFDGTKVMQKTSFYAREGDYVEKDNIYLKEINLEEEYVVFYLFVGEEGNFFCSSGEKNLIAKNFNVIKNPDGSGVQILLNYEEEGLSVKELCDIDDYIVEFYYSIDGGKNFESWSKVGREGLELNGPGIDFPTMLHYKLTNVHLILLAKMDSYNMFNELMDVEPSPKLGQKCSNDAECENIEIGEKSTGLICRQNKCISLLDMNNYISETNEEDNCIQQEFKVKPLLGKLKAVSSVTPCIF